MADPSRIRTAAVWVGCPGTMWKPYMPKSIHNGPDELLSGIQSEADMNEIGRRIKDKIVEIYRSDNFTIAFLPYKRSMWDSMESVYEECVKSGIKTYVCPLPYLRKFGEQRAEILDKDEFEYGTDIMLLPELNTDFVVIHYPYDGHNRVTSMIPKYYTAELKQYGQVIYIPYSCSNMKMLRVQPGIANVDYAFLGSEAEAESFISEWAQMGVDFKERAFGLGSPKMDAIRKTSSGNATIILNSLAPFLYEPFERINKYKRIMVEETAKGRNVIFRPHPLLRQTIQSMRPDTESEYTKMLIFAEALGVEIDETENLEATLGRADYLISDHSSVLEMWIRAGREYRII